MPPLLRFDPSAAFVPKTGIEQSDVASLGPLLDKLRDEICEIDVRMLAGAIATPSSKQPLHGGFYRLPEQQLAEYEADRSGSELALILAATKRLMSEVDRVVVVGSGGSFLGARAVMDACCQPYFNELSRGERGSRPRICFAGNSIDNDLSQGLLHLLGAHRGQAATSVDDSWGLVVISKSGRTLETTVAFRQYLAALETSCGGDMNLLRRRLISVTGNASRLHAMVRELGCQDIFRVPENVGGRFSVLSPVGLVPAALMGVNVMQLLAGASAMNHHFRTTQAADNLVLQYAAINHLMETKRGAHVRRLVVWSQALESAGKWYEHLLAASLGKSFKGAIPLTTVNTRDLHARPQSHQEGRRDEMVNQVIVDDCRFDPLPVGKRTSDVDQLNDIADKTLPDLMAVAQAGTAQSLLEHARPSTSLSMPLVDEFSLGQFFQMLMLATVVEGRLLGVNPYGQPAVDAFKNRLNRMLGR